MLIKNTSKKQIKQDEYKIIPKVRLNMTKRLNYANLQKIDEDESFSQLFIIIEILGWI